MFETNGAEFCELFLSEAQKIVNTDASKGNGGDNKSDKKASEQLTELAEKLSAEKKIDFAEALDSVMDANPKLVDQQEREALEG